MIKTMLLSTILVAGLGVGVAAAQERTVSVWGANVTAYDAQPSKPGVVALAPRDTRSPAAIAAPAATPDRSLSVWGANLY